jgi:hypothetical protein
MKSLLRYILIAELKKLHFSKYDNRTTQKPGFKFAEWEQRVPVRIVLDKDLENGTFEVARRYFDKRSLKMELRLISAIYLRKFRQICLIKH